MATYEQLIQAARQADAVGDERAARRFLELAAEARKTPEQNTNPGVAAEAPPEMIYNPNTGQYTSRELLAGAESKNMSGPKAFAVGGGQGVSFGAMDEIGGAVNALVPGAGTMAERNTFGREATRAQAEAARAAHPIASGLGEAGGAFSTALAYGLPAFAQRGLGSAMMANAGVGAAEGSAYGLMSGEGGIANRAEEAARYGLLGAGVGAAAPLVTSAARSVARGVGDVVSGGADRVLGRGSQSRANRAIDATLKRSGMSPDDVAQALAAAQRQGQPEFAVADALGQAGQRRLSGLTRSGGDLAQETAEYLNTRQLGQPERVASFVEEGFGMVGDSAARREAALTAARKAAADVEYEAARVGARPVNLTSAIETLDDLMKRDPILGESALTDTVIGKRLMSVRNQLEREGEQLIDFDKVLNIKQDLWGQMQTMQRSGQSVPPQIAQTYKLLDEALEASSDGYRAANDNFRRASQVIDAITTGKEAARPGARAIDTTDQFAKLTPEQQAAARVGYGDTLLQRVETARPGANRADPLLTPKIQREIEAMALDPATLSDRLRRETTMFETRNRALGGSRTADNMEDIADLQGFDIGLLGNLLTGNFKAAAGRAGAGLSNALTGMNENTRRIVAQAMLAKDTTALQKALAQAQTATERKLVVDTLLRVGGQHSGLLQ